MPITPGLRYTKFICPEVNYSS
ncbi:hypothetical protein C4546_01745 [Candidatus Parcubacteria bacterium]|nr:MAG: hypothetical protein C4546_01745 [Candidatus Parcubacteria bacterium]